MKLAAAVSFIAVVIGISLWMQVSVWNECRAGHSALYCLRLVSK